uniref:Uncharacterized protein n=1 Tax=Timema bartmani TaxID=61472 RepID=A0A7R9I1S5_9NEOP|nr:unnamed protein product [Timema bartmani]
MAIELEKPVNMVNGISVNGLGEVAMDATPQSSNLIGLGKQLSNDLSLVQNGSFDKKLEENPTDWLTTTEDVNGVAPLPGSNESGSTLLPSVNDEARAGDIWRTLEDSSDPKSADASHQGHLYRRKMGKSLKDMSSHRERSNRQGGSRIHIF